MIKLKKAETNYDKELFNYYITQYDYINLRELDNVKDIVGKGKSWGINYKTIMNTRLKLIQHFNDWLAI